MKMIKYKINKISLVVFTMLTLSLFSLTTQAADQYIQLKANSASCDVTLDATGNSGCDKGQCNEDASCVCVSKGDHVHWLLNSDDKFKLEFPDGSPLKDNCGKNFKKSKHKCVVKEDAPSGSEYSYEIYIQRCEGATDPKIVIK